MDARDLAFWEYKAARKTILDRVTAIQAARFAMVDDETYRIEMMRWEWALKLLDRSTEKKDGRGIQSWLDNR
jgi:hypothetical protein